MACCFLVRAMQGAFIVAEFGAAVVYTAAFFLQSPAGNGCCLMQTFGKVMHPMARNGVTCQGLFKNKV